MKWAENKPFFKDSSKTSLIFEHTRICTVLENRSENVEKHGGILVAICLKIIFNPCAWWKILNLPSKQFSAIYQTGYQTRRGERCKFDLWQHKYMSQCHFFTALSSSLKISYVCLQPVSLGGRRMEMIWKCI